MIGGGTLSLLALVGVSAAVPHLLARDGLRARLVRLDAISTGVLLAMWHVAGVLDLGVTPAAACGAFFAAKVAVAAAALAATGDWSEVEWSPGRAGLVAGLVYLALIPNILAWPIDGDESFYVLSAESILRDFDLDLRNQYDELETSVTRRLDLRPQLGDPIGPNGELYSRHEPLLSLILIPGLVSGGLPGAVATMAILAALAMRAIVALMKDEGVGTRAQVFVFGFVGLMPPFLNYALRIWPEVPGALLLSEMLRAARSGKIRRAIVFGVLLSALKIRFVPVAVTLLFLVLIAGRVRRRWIVSGMVAIAGVLGVVALFFPGVITSRTFDPRAMLTPDNFAKGLLGIPLDGQAGLLFQAPLFLMGLATVLRWRRLGKAAKLGCIAALPYLVLLVPRSEWHGGWSPPLRYLVVFAPVFALLVAAAAERVIGRAAILAAAGWTATLAATAIALPPSVFRIASGESALGEHLSAIWGSDFSSLIPSLIRPNGAVVWFGAALMAATAVVAIRRDRGAGGAGPVMAAAMAIAITASAWAGLQPRQVVEFEDTHVEKRGGELHPEMWTPARFRFRGGWTLLTGDAVGFRHPGGTVSLTYYCDQPTVIEVDGEAYEVPTGTDYADLVFVLPQSVDDRHEIRCERGALILDRLAKE